MSRYTLANLREQKTLLKGRHWWVTRLTYQWHVPRIEKLMSELMEA